MSKPVSPIGHSWEDVEEEFMSLLTPAERADMSQSVIALGELLDAKDAGRITEAEFNAAFDTQCRFAPVAPRVSYG